MANFATALKRLSPSEQASSPSLMGPNGFQQWDQMKNTYKSRKIVAAKYPSPMGSSHYNANGLMRQKKEG